MFLEEFGLIIIIPSVYIFREWPKLPERKGFIFSSWINIQPKCIKKRFNSFHLSSLLILSDVYQLQLYGRVFVTKSRKDIIKIVISSSS